MKNTFKLILAAFVVAVATSCGGEKKESSENTDTTTTVETAPAPVEEVPADTVAVDTTAAQ